LAKCDFEVIRIVQSIEEISVEWMDILAKVSLLEFA